MMEVYTIGHSNRSLSDFISILKSYGVKAVVDVRRFPTSRKFPYFKKEVLKEELRKNGLRYFWLGELLGGFRKGGYKGHIGTEEFKLGMRKLVEAISRETTAILCSELLWFKCHRRFIADELANLGYNVIHIIDKRKAVVHRPKDRDRSLVRINGFPKSGPIAWPVED